MAWIGFRHHEAIRRQFKAQKLLAFIFFYLQVFIDNINNNLYSIVLVILAAEGSRQKMRFSSINGSKFEILEK